MMDSAKKATWVVGGLVALLAAMLGLAYASIHWKPWVFTLFCIVLLWVSVFGALYFVRDKDIHL